MSVALAAASLGFLLWNRPPAKIFMGDVGSGFLGFVLGLLRLLASYQQANFICVPTLLMHGDLLCSDDVAYLAFREKSHSEDWQVRML